MEDLEVYEYNMSLGMVHNCSTMENIFDNDRYYEQVKNLKCISKTFLKQRTKLF